MALATSDDVEAALRRPLTSEEDVGNLLEEASDLVAGYLHTIPDPVPEAVSRVVATMVAAVLLRPANLTGLAAGDALGAGVFNVRVGADSGGPWLTNALKLRLRPYRPGCVAVPARSELYGPEDES